MTGEEDVKEDPYAERKRLTFEQAEGAEPLPTQLALKTVSQELKALIWSVFVEEIQPSRRDYSVPSLPGPWEQILRAKWVQRDHRLLDEFENHHAKRMAELKREVTSDDYLVVFGLLQWLLRLPQTPTRFRQGLAKALKRGRAAYEVIDDTTIVPLSSLEGAKAVRRAFADLQQAEFSGARKHLADAAAAATAGQWATSINASIDAVEAVARVLSGENTLKQALEVIGKRTGMHKALRSSLLRLYDFTSDEKGLRHSLADLPDARVDQEEALLALGTAASFVSYLINKSR